MKKKKIIIAVVSIVTLIVVLGGALGISCLVSKKGLKEIIGSNDKKKLIDDWKYTSSADYEDVMYETSAIAANKSITNSMVSSDSTLGFAVGGAKNINNFRENIKNGYLPISTDLTYNGLFSDYYFNTGRSGSQNNKFTNEMFYPTYSLAYSKDPISEKYERYMTVGLNSNINECDFQRKKLNLVVVLDVSGSMSSGFNEYYYDRTLQLDCKKDKTFDNRSKMVIANESVNCLIDQLKQDDRLGIVLFDNQSYLAKPLNLVGETDITKTKEHILTINPKGGTNFEAGYTKGTELFTKGMLNNDEYENRIIVVTDAMPNLGNTSKDGLTKYVKENADKGIYTSFVGVGVDFNTEVIECLSDVKGSNYYSVHSSEEFKKIMGEEFNYMVTPLVFDLELKLDSNEYEIAGVYGTDTKNKSTGTIMKVNTLFPSSSNSEGEVKGGVVLLKLNPLMFVQEYPSAPHSTKIIVSYKDRNGKVHSNEQEVNFEKVVEEKYDNTGIRKAIVLKRYADLMKDWVLYERASSKVDNNVMTKNKVLVTDETGIIDCPYLEPEDVKTFLGENERQSQRINVSEEYVNSLMKFKNYIKNEITEIGDDEMNQEVELLDRLVKE